MIDAEDLLLRLAIPYRRSGIKLLADCPAHNDTTQRWVIFAEGPRAGGHRCLSCGFSGGPVKLVMERLQLARGAAIEFLGSSERGAPIVLDVAVETRDPRRPGMLPPSDVQFAEWYDWPERFLDYLGERDVTSQQAERWGLGFVDDAQERPALRNRVWIPVRSIYGGLAAWTARTVSRNAQPKYLSSSRADGTDEGALLGEVFWPPPEERERLVVVEGPFDALAIDRLGMHVAALRGSNLDPGQAMRLASWRHIVVATDPDTAGAKGALALQGIGRHTDVRRAILPSGTDVAELAVNSVDVLRHAIEAACDDTT